MSIYAIGPFLRSHTFLSLVVWLREEEGISRGDKKIQEGENDESTIIKFLIAILGMIINYTIYKIYHIYKYNDRYVICYYINILNCFKQTIVIVINHK